MSPERGLLDAVHDQPGESFGIKIGRFLGHPPPLQDDPEELLCRHRVHEKGNLILPGYDILVGVLGTLRKMEVPSLLDVLLADPQDPLDNVFVEDFYICRFRRGIRTVGGGIKPTAGEHTEHVLSLGILLDEPEAGHDLQWIIKIRKGLYMLSKKNCQIILATHHPVFWRNANIIELKRGYIERSLKRFRKNL